MIEKIEEYASIYGIPIMQKDGISYLCNFIREHNIKRILEIGSAIGYSAIMMASVDDDISVTTIERDVDRYNKAKENISLFNYDNRINIILGDAMDINIDMKFDLIFIDASKGHNIDFFNRYKVNLDDGGYIITDNLSFHGLVENPSLAKTKNQRGIVRKISNYITFLDSNSEFETKYINVGDKISISRRKYE